MFLPYTPRGRASVHPNVGIVRLCSAPFLVRKHRRLSKSPPDWADTGETRDRAMAADNYDTLLDAIARNAGAVLSLPSAGMLRHHKSRFLSESAGGFWVESAPGEAALIDSLIASQQPAGISFKNGHLKVVFASPIQR